MSNAQIQALARRLAVLERDRVQRKQPNLGFSTIDGGAIQAQDHDDQLTMVIGAQYDGTNTAAVVSGPPPPEPTLPLVTESNGSLRIYWDGTFVDGAVAPMDFARVLVYAEPTLEYAGPEPLNQALIVGGFTSATGGEVTAALSPNVEYNVYLVTWSQAGKYGPASQIATGTPSLEGVPDAPPPNSPVLSVVGMPDSFLLQTAPTDPTTLLTFQVSTDDGATWTALDNMPVRSTIYQTKNLPSGDPYLVDTDYRFRVLASNAAGPAPGGPSADVSSRLDTSVVALVASQIIASEVYAGFKLVAGRIEVGGDAFTLTPPGVDPNNPQGGLRIDLANGGLIHLPADGSDAVIEAHIIAQSLNVKAGAEISGDSHLGGTIELGAMVDDPTTAPTVVANYLRIAPPAGISDATGFCRTAEDDGWVVLSNTQSRLYRFDDTGTLTDTINVDDLAPSLGLSGITMIGSHYYIQVRTNFPRWYKVPAALTTGADGRLTSATLIAGTGQLGSTYSERSCGRSETGEMVHIASQTYSGGDTLVRRYDPDTGAQVGSTVTLSDVSGAYGGAHWGSADFGADRITIWLRNEINCRVYNTSGALQSGVNWARPSTEQVRGLWWDGTHFWACSSIGAVRRFESATDAPAATYYWSYAWVDSDTHHTGPSPQFAFARPRRARMYVTAQPAPQEGYADVHIANKIQMYASTISGGGLQYPQGAVLAEGERSLIHTIVTSTGTLAPSNNWAGVTNPGVISAADQGFWIDGNSDGDVGWGGFAESIRLYMARFIQRGTTSVSGTSIAVGGTVTVNVTFPEEFDIVPTVTASGSGFASGGGFMIIRSCDNITTTGFRLVVANIGNSAATFTNLPYQWIATSI